MFAWADEDFNISPNAESRLVRGLWVSGDFFPALGVQPELGRLFSSADDYRGCGLNVAVISYQFWQTEFGGDRSVLGRKISFDAGKRSVPVIGVTPPSFFGLEVGRQFDVALPVCADAAAGDDRRDSGTTWWLTVMGRLKPGVSIERANANLRMISGAVFETTLPPDYPAISVKPYLAMKLGAIPAQGGLSKLRDDYSASLALLLTIAGLVLAIACANIANLMLARAASRSREIAVRLAIGAARWDLIRQLMAEGFLLAVAGTCGALFLARELNKFLVAFLSSDDNSTFVDLQPDWRVFLFAALLAIATTILFNLAPALQASRTQPMDALRSGTRGSTANRQRFGLRRALASSQITLSLVLTVAAISFAQSLRNLMTIKAGFQQTGILLVQTGYGAIDSAARGRISALRHDVIERMRALPGVDAAAEAGSLPVNGNNWVNRMWLDGEDDTHSRDISRGLVGAGYFQAIGTHLLAGREFDERDTLSTPNVAIVSASFLRVFGLSTNAVGRRFWIEKTPFAAQTRFEIVGVVEDSKYRDLRQDFLPVIFIPMSQFPQALLGGSVVVRSRLPLDRLTAELRSALAEANPQIMFRFSVLQTRIERSLLRERLMAFLSGLFGVLAVVLATVGLYGVVAYTTARRTNEFGIRLALGSTRANVRTLVLGEAARLLAVGLGAGLVLLWASGRLASALLYGVSADDPRILGVASALLISITLIASYLPARRATLIDPASALRQE
jgi:predicted permease